MRCVHLKRLELASGHVEDVPVSLSRVGPDADEPIEADWATTAPNATSNQPDTTSASALKMWTW
jgi:hypothetical protein